MNTTRLRTIAKPVFALTLATAIVPAASGQDTAQAPAPMTARDLVTMPRVGGPAVSPDGRWMLYRVTRTDDRTLARNAHYMVQPINGTQADRITLSLPEGAGSPAFGTDGWLYFLAPGSAAGEAGPVMQLWRSKLSDDGLLHSVAQISDVDRDIAGFVLSPQADRIVLFGDIPRSCASFSCPQAAPSETREIPGATGRLYDDDIGFVRHWDQWEVAGERSRAIAYTLRNGTLQDPVALDGPAGGLDADTPTKPFGGAEDIAFAADGVSVFFVAREGGSAEPGSTDLDIYRTSIVSGATPQNLTSDNDASDALPTPSPDGKWLAYAAMARPGYESDRMVIQLRDLATGQTRALTQDFDRSFGSLGWTPDSRYLIATAQDVLDTPAFRIDPRSGGVDRLDLVPDQEAHIGNIVPLEDGRVLFTRDSIATPAEIFIADPSQAASGRALTSVASSQTDRLAPIATQRFSFAGAGGDTVWGQITKPTGHEGTLPAILYIHGGPQGSFNDGWSSRWNPRVLASQGYAVVSVDFHGSTGYGQTFTDSINRDWGGKPLEDLQKGLAAALERDPQIDGTRACAMGASYGGYMVNWIAGNWPDRFRCLIQHDGLFDMRMFYYTTEELWFPRWDFGGSYVEARETYERWNPVNHVGNWRTPMLVIAGEQDFRIPYTQGLASFTALQEQGVEAELLVFPDENHWVLGAANSLQWHRTVFDWLDRWLQPEAQGE